MAMQVKAVDHPNNIGFGCIDLQPLLLAASTACNVGGYRLIAKRRAGAIKKTLARILFHGARGVLAVLAALMLVKQGNNSAHHFAARIVARRLRNGYDFDFVLGELPFVDAEFDTIAEETRQAVNNDSVEGGRFYHRVRNHLLKDRTFIIGGGCPPLDVFMYYRLTVRLAPLVQLA